MSMQASFIGLGNMGMPMSRNLMKNGVKVYVYNRSKEKADPLINEGAQLLSSPGEAFDKTSIVFSMVANDTAHRDIVEGKNGLLAKAKPGCIHVSMSTISPEISREFALKYKEKGAIYLSAPVFGRPEVAGQQKLWICVSGEPIAKKQIEPFLLKMGQKVFDFGDLPEFANIVKLSGNFMILSTMEMLSEAFAYLEKCGISSETYHNFLSNSLFSSVVVQTYGGVIAHKKFTPPGLTMELGLKDINLFLQSAGAMKVPVPMASLIHDRLLAGIANHRGKMDWSAISLISLEQAGLFEHKR